MALAPVIDDDPQVRTLLAMMLKRAGYDVAQAKDGLEGIEPVPRWSPRWS